MKVNFKIIDLNRVQEALPWIVLLLALTACELMEPIQDSPLQTRDSPTEQPIGLITEIPSATPTTAILPEPTLTETLQPETPTLSASASPTPSQTQTPTSSSAPAMEYYASARLQKQCMPVQPLQEEKYFNSGKLILRGSGDYFFLNSDGERNNLIVDRAVEYLDDVSPDRQMMVISSLRNGHEIMNISGEIIKIFDVDDQWKQIEWLDNNYWLIRMRNPGNSLIIYDPWSEQLVSELTISDQDAFKFESPPGQYVTTIHVDPSGTRAIYFSQENGGQAILWNFLESKELGRLPFYIGKEPLIPQSYQLDSDPLDTLYEGWSPDGSQFLLPVPIIDVVPMPESKQELFSISREGYSQQLTFLNQLFGYTRIEDVSWSPDGRYAAFWFQTADEYQPTENLDHRLGIYDWQTGLVTDYCVESQSTKSDIVWAPDSTKLIVKPDLTKTVLLNLEEGKLIDLPIGKFYIIRWVPDQP